jgi:hypothetical protein
VEPKHDINPAIPQKSLDHNLRITNGVNLGFNTSGGGAIVQRVRLLPGKLPNPETGSSKFSYKFHGALHCDKFHGSFY